MEKPRLLDTVEWVANELHLVLDLCQHELGWSELRALKSQLDQFRLNLQSSAEPLPPQVYEWLEIWLSGARDLTQLRSDARMAALIRSSIDPLESLEREVLDEQERRRARREQSDT